MMFFWHCVHFGWEEEAGCFAFRLFVKSVLSDVICLLPLGVIYRLCSVIVALYTVDSRYLKVQGTLRNTTRYPYLDISDLQN